LDTIVYVDAFNLYYGCCKEHPDRKWLDVQRLCRLLLKREHRITKIRYFTALVKPRTQDPRQRERQEVYLRALRTIPGLEVHLGSFRTHKVMMAKADTDPQEYVLVYRTEEKGSDVNLATHLLNDAHLGAYEAAVVVSNDSDLVEPIRMVRESLGKKVVVLNPFPKRSSAALRKHSDIVIPIRAHAVRRSQFTDTLEDQHGTITRPDAWSMG
jgi:uncharacterized LabA/DUF88 family protein